MEALTLIPTLTSDGFLHKVNRHRQRFLTELERRKAFRYCIAILTCFAIIVMAWILAPVRPVSLDKGEAVTPTTQPRIEATQ